VQSAPLPDQKKDYIMRKLLFACAALAALTMPANAAFVATLGNNPTSATGHFSNAVNGATFVDDFTFSLSGASQFVAFASATNDFAVTGGSDFISNFTGQLFSFGADLLPFTADDVARSPIATPHPCADNPGNCQALSGSAILDAGGYYLQFTGTGGGTAGYGGDLTTAAIAAVPEPSTWAMMILGFAGIVTMAARRKRKETGHAFRWA
jgi:PEP-CTERM motif